MATEDLETASIDTVYQQLGTTTKGLTSTEAKARIEQYGRNELVAKEVSDLEKFLRFFWGPIAWMIEAAALLSLLMGHWADLSIILVASELPLALLRKARREGIFYHALKPVQPGDEEELCHAVKCAFDKADHPDH